MKHFLAIALLSFSLAQVATAAEKTSTNCCPTGKCAGDRPICPDSVLRANDRSLSGKFPGFVQESPKSKGKKKTIKQ